MVSDRKKIASDGKSTNYYKIPATHRTISELISYKNMRPAIGDIFRMCYELHYHDRKVITEKLLLMKNLIQNYDNPSNFEFVTDIDVPEHASELRHLISYVGMSKSRGDVFKACYRLGEKKGTDEEYDINKIEFFIDDLIEMNDRGEHI